MDIYKVFDSLGTTEKEVVDNLRKLGIKGKYRTNDCPIARYLRSLTNEEWTVLLPMAYTIYRGLPIPLPIYIQDFIEHFDGGRYHDLLEE